MGRMDTASPAGNRFQRNGSTLSPGLYETEHARNNVKRETSREAHLKLASNPVYKRNESVLAQELVLSDEELCVAERLAIYVCR